MKILIADDHDLVREALGNFLEIQGALTVDLACDLHEALQFINSSDEPYGVVLLDYGMPGMNGLEGLQKAIEAARGKPVALMSGTASREIAEDALSKGAAGFIPKTLGMKSMLNALRFMAEGEQFAPAKWITEPEEIEMNELAAKLSERERQVLQGLCSGYSNKQIARDLDLQEVTIKLHVKTLSRKLEARNRTHAAMIARDAGLF
ncbi:MAG: response regulator transcription factor [Rhizobiaceae bacterium]|nr:response regulator transcription factor [Rhizobiaceae bacterium]